MPQTVITGELINDVNILNKWKLRVSNMQNFDIGSFEIERANNKYYRFIGFMQNWIENEFIPGEQKGGEWEDATEKMAELQDGWWKNAIDVANGKKVTNALPVFLEDAHKKAAYEKFMPAYRVLKDSFSKRSVFQFIFNHRQYTAERDALKVLTAVITTLTGDTKEQLDAKYLENKQKYPFTELKDYLNQYSEEVNQDRIEAEEKRQDQVLKEDADAMFFRDGVVYTGEDKKDEIVIGEQDEKPIVNENAIEEGNLTREQKALNVQAVIKEKNADGDAITNFSKETYAQIKNKINLAEFATKLLITKLCNQIKLDSLSVTNNFVEEVQSEQQFIDQGYNGDVEFDKSENMQICAKKAFKTAFEQMGAWKFKTLKDRIVTAQQITDKMLKDYSPIGYYGKEFAVYGDKYALTNRDIVREIVTSATTNASETEIESAIDQARAELNIKEAQKEQIIISDLAESVNLNTQAVKIEGKQIEAKKLDK